MYLLVEREHAAGDELPEIVREEVDGAGGVVGETGECGFDVYRDEGVEVLERGVKGGAVEEREDWGRTNDASIQPESDRQVATRDSLWRKRVERAEVAARRTERLQTS